MTALNVVSIESTAPQNGSMLDYALRYAALGWHVFPVWGAKDSKCRCRRMCKSPGKHPVEHIVPRGQDDATTDPATIRRMWAQMPDAGIGVFLKPSGLCAIDIDPRNGGFETIDQIEAKHGALASDVMAFTQGGGEHRVFKLSDGINLPGKLGPGVDVKLNGYIVLDPTHGPLGVYAWEASSDPLDGCIPSPLPDWLRGLAAPEVQAPVTEASRIVTPGQLDELRSALTSFPSDDRDLWIKIGMALHSIGQDGYYLWREWSEKSPKFDPVDLARVWRSFKPGQMNYETVFHVAQAHGWINPLAGFVPMPEAVPVETVKTLPKREEVSTPAHLLNPPGILGQVAQWIGVTSRKPQPQFDVQAAISFCATVMGRRYVTTQRNWPSLYLLNIGKSASGKEHGKWAVEKLLEECGLDRLIGPSNYTSNSGVLSALGKQPSHITIIDEFGKVLEASTVKASARAASARTALMECWGRCDGTIRPQGFSTFGMSAKDAERAEDRSIRNPALTLLAMTTPESFFESIQSAAARDGFLNRFLIVESDMGRQVGRPVVSAPVPQTVIDWSAETHAHAGLANPDITGNLAAVPKMVGILKEADALFHSFEAEAVSLMDQYETAGLSEMFGRANEVAMRLALVVAVASGWSSINADHAQWAIDYVRHYTIRAADRLATSVADSEFEAVCKQVITLIGKAGENGLTEREISKSSRKMSALDHRGRMNVLTTLANNADICKVTFPSTSGRGQSRQAWVLIDADKTPT